MDDFRRGERSMRDNIIAMIIGFQNGNNNTESTEYKAYQRVLEAIEERHGELMSR